jgi:hypothetical protein
MKACHAAQQVAKDSAVARLLEFVEERRSAAGPPEDIEAFERHLHEMSCAVEREILGEELAKFDIDVPVVLVDGVAHRQVLRCEETYFGGAGPIRVMRSLYSDRSNGERSICPLELRAGLVEGRWTPLAAKQACWVTAHLTPGEGEELFQMLGGMTPSKSSLDRLPKQVSARWEADREHFEGAIRADESVPREAVSVAVSLDGVMVPMRHGDRQAKREQAAASGKQTKGPAGFKEVGCGTVSFYDVDGDRLETRRFARMPESKKVTLKQMLLDELNAALAQRPDLDLVKVADGAEDNWTFLSGEELPDGVEVVDFFHASEHLNAALIAAYGETNPKRRSQFKKLRTILREEDDGVEKVIRSLAYLRNRYARRKKIATELNYFRKNRHRMRYAEVAGQDLPIGSGVVEASCKTLATQRLKRSGMRWCHDGGQAILTLRAAVQSDRFDRTWDLLAATYKVQVEMPENVVALSSRRVA